MKWLLLILALSMAGCGTSPKGTNQASEPMYGVWKRVGNKVAGQAVGYDPIFMRITETYFEVARPGDARWTERAAYRKDGSRFYYRDGANEIVLDIGYFAEKKMLIIKSVSDKNEDVQDTFSRVAEADRGNYPAVP